VGESRSLPAPVLILASASPRRAELLSSAGIAFDVLPAHVDETVRAGESPQAYVRRLAEAKALTVALAAPDRSVLGADTIVVVDSLILGKPRDAEDAKRMLRLLSGRSHHVITAVSLCLNDTALSTEVEMTRVEFAHLDKAEIDWYVATGEPAGKAGGYAIQGLASRFVKRIEGSYANVVGLPVALVYAMCTRAGILLS
jgi:septum formation protein